MIIMQLTYIADIGIGTSLELNAQLQGMIIYGTRPRLI